MAAFGKRTAAHASADASLAAGSFKTAHTIMIPEATVKFVVGKSGRQFKLLRSRAGIASLWLDPKTHELTARGEAAAVKSLVEEVGAIIARAERTLAVDNIGRLRLGVDDHLVDSGSGVGRLYIVNTIAIPTPAVPFVVGKKGATIKRLGRMRGIINVQLEVDPEGGDVLRIEGEPDSVTAVMIDVQSLLKKLREGNKILRAAELARAKAASAAWGAGDVSAIDIAADGRRTHEKREEAAKIAKQKEALRFPRLG